MPSVKLLRILPLAVLLLLWIPLAAQLLNGSSLPAGRMLNRMMPVIDLPALGQPEKRFSSELWQGKPAIINIFATWCLPCQAEHAALLYLSAAADTPLYGIAWKDKEENIARWLAAHKNPYRLVGLDRTGDVTVPLAMRGIPETLIVDGNGKVRYHVISTLTKEEIDAVILPLLRKLREEAMNG